MAESLSVNNLTRQIAREEILNNQRQESFKSYFRDDITYSYTTIYIMSLFLFFLFTSIIEGLPRVTLQIIFHSFQEANLFLFHTCIITIQVQHNQKFTTLNIMYVIERMSRT